jgi:uncharacterized protein (TIGR02466 family)
MAVLVLHQEVMERLLLQDFDMNDFNMLMLFPCNVMFKEERGLITENLISISKEILLKNAETPFHSKCISTVRTKSDILELSEFSGIKQFLGNLVYVYCEQMKIDCSKLSILDSWLNLYEEGGYQDLHNHHDSMISGVFWLQSSEEKDFVFQAPWHFMQPKLPNYTEYNLNNCHNVEINSNVGRGMVFMSHMLHRTLPTKTERISLSFNVG